MEDKKALEEISNAIRAWDLGAGDVDILLRIREVMIDTEYMAVPHTLK